MPDVISAEAGALDAATVTALQAMGHKVNAGEATWGNLQTVSWDKRRGTLEGGTDPRNPVGAAEVLPRERAALPCDRADRRSARSARTKRPWNDAAFPPERRMDPYNTVDRPPPGGLSLTDAMVTTALELPGYRIVRNVGIVRGITVRSRSIVGNFLGGIQTLFGGNITIYTQLCEQARQETYRDMLSHGRHVGANAIVAMRYDATELMAGLTEVLCYGTAVVVEPVA